VLLSGPAGTGKSLACLLRLYHDATTIPGLRCLIVRKTRASLTESALVTLERDILEPSGVEFGRASRAMRRSYPLANGSQIVIGGLDSQTKIMSTDFDRVYVQEAIELVEAEWETITTRLGRGGNFGQLISDTNPDKPSHWLKQRCDLGRTLMLESRHEDNPVLYDATLQDWTPAGTAYLEKLDKLTGPRLQRLRHGRWVQAEGVVYDGWDAAVHLLDRVLIRDSWPRYLAIDFGYTNPFVCQWWAQDPDGRLYLYRETYRTQRLVEDHARSIKYLGRNEPAPRAVICDHDAEDRATLMKHLGLPTTPARKEISPGIQAVASRLRPAGDGKPRLFILRDALVERDERLAEAKLPGSTVEEIDGYVWDTGGNRRTGEQPLKLHDHGMDCVRCLVMHFDRRARVVHNFTGCKFGMIRPGAARLGGF
jgi:phage terminase large subunit